MNKIIMVLLCFAASLNGVAQNSVSGKVTDTSGEPLIGVTVLIQKFFSSVKTESSSLMVIKSNFQIVLSQNFNV